MSLTTFPTSTDIYIEVEGKRLAVAQSYKARTTKESRYVEAFGSREPAGTAEGRVKHVLELTRVCAAIGGEINFHELSGFNVVIVRPDRKIIFSGCNWTGIQEAAALGEVLFETVTIAAARRLEVRT